VDINKLALFSIVKKRMNWLSQRQEVLSQNIANSDTPEYKLKTGRYSALLEDFTMKRLLRLARPALFMTLATACAPAPIAVGGGMLATVGVLNASSNFVSSTLVENGLRNANAGGEDTADPVVLMPAVATDRGAAEPSAFTIFFNFDSTNLITAQSDRLDAIVAAAKAGDQVRLVVSGHADRAGPEPYNVSLSRRRALTVKEALHLRGLNRDWITVTAHGETRPRIATPDGTREPRNRRVEIILGEAPSL
jgi:outer membrane protein OmpA-like peptidoglycan-associated protein